MEGAFFLCPPAWERWLPPGVRSIRSVEELGSRQWGLLVLTPEGGLLAGETVLSCRELLLPGECRTAAVPAETVVTYGLSRRDSLTLSSLCQPLLCVQRTLPRLQGPPVEPQELPLERLPLPAESLLPLLGAWLLQMQQTELHLPW